MSIIAPYIHHNIAKRVTKTLRDILAYNQETNRAAIKRVNVSMRYSNHQSMVKVDRVDESHSGTGVFFSENELQIINSADSDANKKLMATITEAIQRVLKEQHYSVVKTTFSEYMDIEFYVLRE